jgi:hypothetical protein
LNSVIASPIDNLNADQERIATTPRRLTLRSSPHDELTGERAASSIDQHNTELSPPVMELPVSAQNIVEATAPELSGSQLGMPEKGLGLAARRRAGKIPLAVQTKRAIQTECIAKDGCRFSLNRIRETANGSYYFHGAVSPSMMAFSHTRGEARGHLLPMRRLIQKGITPFSGEQGYSLHPHAPNSVSVVDLERFAIAYDYGSTSNAHSNTKVWSVDQARSSLEQARKYIGKMSNDAAEDMNTAKIALLEKQLAEYELLNEQERSLIDHSFPVIYGISGDLRKQPNRIQPAMSDISGEALISEEVKPEDIKVIYLPENFIPMVKKLLSDFDIPLQPLESLQPMESL